MELNLTGKKALVTGSSSGIGEGIARTLAREGVDVVVHYRNNRDGAEAIARDINAAGGGRAYVVQGDLTTDEGAQKVHDEARQHLGQVDILINNVGAYANSGWEATIEDWKNFYDSDVLTAVRMNLLFKDELKQQGWGRIIQITSAAAGLTPANFFPYYVAAKAAMTNMTRSLAMDLAGTGVTVNNLAPGPMATETFKKLYTEEAAQEGRSTKWEDVQEHYIEKHMQDPPVRRFPVPDEIGALAAFMCSSPYGDVITASTYTMDSGYNITGFKRV